jgi:hypothetical protein
VVSVQPSIRRAERGTQDERKTYRTTLQTYAEFA